jgi:hypothetical protein
MILLRFGHPGEFLARDNYIPSLREQADHIQVKMGKPGETRVAWRITGPVHAARTL